MVEKIDFKKSLNHLYNPSKVGFHIIDVPRMNFLMVDGSGNPNTDPDYQWSVEALYSISYGIKFAMKAQGHDHIIPPLEGLWWMDNMDEFTVENKERWKWTMMVMQPEWIQPSNLEAVRSDVRKKKANEFIDKVRFESFIEGLAVQILYTGAYVDEGPVIAEMHRYIQSGGYRTNGKHHEIYLGDPRKLPPTKLKTILRQAII